MTEERLPPPDLSSVLTILGDRISSLVVEALDGTGLRHGHGYLLQRLLTGPATASEVAQELGITQQAVSKAVKELVTLGHVELVADGDDRRRRPARLTPQGMNAVETARAARRSIDDRIRSAVGEAAFAETMATLHTAMEVLGISEAVTRRTVPPPSGMLD